MSNFERVDSPEQRVQDVKVVEEALARAVGDALRTHKRAGNPIPEWRDGKVRWLTPEEIPSSGRVLVEWLRCADRHYAGEPMYLRLRAAGDLRTGSCAESASPPMELPPSPP